MSQNYRLQRAIRIIGTVVSTIILLVVFIPYLAGAAERETIPDKYKWNLSDIYPTWEAWEADIPKVKTLISEFDALKGTLDKGPEALLKAFRMRDSLNTLLRRVSAYAGLSYGIDQRNNEIGAKVQRRDVLRSQAKTARSWFLPELVTLPYDSVESWTNRLPELALYKHVIEDEFRKRQHTLDKDQELLLSYFSLLQSSPADIYDALTIVDVKYPTIKLSSGEDVLLTDARYSAIIATNRSQADRAMAFDSLKSVYSRNANTFASIYRAILENDRAVARARGYESSLEKYLDENNIPTAVYENLVETVRNNMGGIRRYFDLKKRLMGQDEYHMYDRYIPIIEFDATYDYDEIAEWVIAAAEPYGAGFQAKVREGFNNRWLDVYENAGKYSGGYCSDVYGVHPYILLNFNGTATDVFTVAHEMGHALHTVLAEETQPYIYVDYPIFLAEVASTAYEQLLLHYMLEKSEDPRERVYLLQYTLDAIRGTFYRQVLFADFEWRAHQLVENDQPVTADVLYNLYMKVIDDYYGDAIAKDSLLGYDWCYIPHFYGSPYYVYQYATCYAAATFIVNDIINGDETARRDAVERLLELQKAGDSDYSMEIMKRAGVDLSKSEVFEAIISLTDRLVTQLEKEIAKLD